MAPGTGKMTGERGGRGRGTASKPDGWALPHTDAVYMFLYMFVLTLTTVEADLSWDGADSDKA